MTRKYAVFGAAALSLLESGRAILRESRVSCQVILLLFYLLTLEWLA